MRQIEPAARWPESWRASYAYDRLEVYGEASHRGYAYAYAARSKQALAMVERAAPPPARVLDVAAAQGNLTLALAERGYDVTWNDLRADLADYVRLKHERGAVRYVPGNILDLRFAEPFDVVLMTEVIEHVAHPDRLLAHLAGLVRDGGHLVLTTPNGGYFGNRLPRFSECADPSVFEAVQFAPNADGHIFLLHADEIEPLARQAGLRVRELRLFTSFLTNGHLKTEGLLHVLPRAVIDRLEVLSARAPFAVRRRLHTAMGVRLQKAVDA